MKVSLVKSVAAAVATAAVITLSAPGVAQASTRPADEPSPVIDSADLFTSAQEQELTEWFASIYSTRDVVGVVETIDALPRRTSIEDFSLERANELGVGEAGKDNGVYVLIAVEDRESRLELGDGVGAVVSDSRAERIMDRTMVPHFRDGEWVEGIQEGVLLVAQAYAPTDAEVAAAEQARQEREAFIAAEEARKAEFWAGFWPLAFTVVGIVAAVVVLIGLIVFAVRRRNAKKAAVRSSASTALSTAMKGGAEVRFAAARGSDERKKVVEAELAKVVRTLPQRQQAWVAGGAQEQIVSAQVVASRDDYLMKNVTSGHELVKTMDAVSIAGARLATESLDSVAPDLKKAVARLNSERRKDVALARKRAKEAERQQAREQARKEAESKKFWNSLSDEQKSKLKRTRDRAERNRLVHQYGGDTSMLPLLVTLGVILSTSSSSSSYSSSSSSSSSSYSGGSSYSSYDGGSFSGGGGSGSW